MHSAGDWQGDWDPCPFSALGNMLGNMLGNGHSHEKKRNNLPPWTRPPPVDPQSIQAGDRRPSGGSRPPAAVRSTRYPRSCVTPRAR